MLMSHTRTYIISNLSWVTGEEQPHNFFKVDWFLGVYIPIYPRRYKPENEVIYFYFCATIYPPPTIIIDLQGQMWLVSK